MSKGELVERGAGEVGWEEPHERGDSGKGKRKTHLNLTLIHSGAVLRALAS